MKKVIKKQLKQTEVSQKAELKEIASEPKALKVSKPVKKMPVSQVQNNETVVGESNSLVKKDEIALKERPTPKKRVLTADGFKRSLMKKLKEE